MQTENQTSKIKPAETVGQAVSEYYFSKKLKEVAQMNAEGKDVISSESASPDMPPSEAPYKPCAANATQTLTDTAICLCRYPRTSAAAFSTWYKRYGVELNPNTEIQRSSARKKVSCTSHWPSSIRANRYWFPIRAIPLIPH